MRVSVIITTYNQPDQLEKVIWGYARQRNADFELLIADDGSRPATTRVIDRVASETGLDILHVWHEDRGFRKTEILNRAIVAAESEYLVFSDGDCIPREDFVAAHARLAKPKCFLSGGYIKLNRDVSSRISIADVQSGHATDPKWLRKMGWVPGRRALRLTRVSLAATLLDCATPTRRTWNGHNASAWKEAVLAVNGFDLDMGYGGLDRALGERLINFGIRGKQVRHRTPCVHLFHERPYVDPLRWKKNHEIRRRIRRNGETRATHGISDMKPDETLLVRRPGQLLARMRAAVAL